MEQPAVTAPAGSADAAADAWFTPGRFAVMLFVFLVAAYPDMFLFMFTDRTFFFRDFGYFGYPLAYYHRESFWHGELPLWNPLNNCGLPFLAQWNTLVLYPGSLFYLLLPLSWSLSLFCLGHLLLAGMGMYWLTYRWTQNRLAAAVAGLAFAFNGLSFNCLMWPNNVAALGWMPVVVLAVERGWQEGGRRLIWAALAGAMQMLAGAPELILFTWGFLAVMLLSQWVRNPAERARLSGRCVLVVLLITGLTAAQMFPFLDLLQHSQRSAGFATTDWSMPESGWANLMVPMFRCFANRQGVYFQAGQYWTSSYYLGIAVLAFAMLTAGQLREGRVRLLLAGSLLGLILALGNQGYLFPWLRAAIPQFGFMRFPIKFIVAPAFCIPLLAAFTVQRHQTMAPDGRARFWRWILLVGAGVLLLIGGILWFDYRYPLVPDLRAETWPSTWRSGLSRAGFLILILGALFALRQVDRPRMRILLRVGLLLLLGLDVFTHAPRQNPTVPRWLFTANLQKLMADSQSAPQPELGQSRAMLSPFADMWLRYHSTDRPVNDYYFSRRGLFSNCNLLDGIPKVNGFFSLYPRGADEVISRLYASTNSSYPALWDFLGVSEITAPGKVVDWVRRDHPLPVITAGQKPVFEDSSVALQALLSSNFNPRTEVYLPLEARPFITATNPAPARIVDVHFAAQRIVFQVEASQASLVVLSQSYYHPWRAYVDGRPTRIWPANVGFQALEVPGGPERRMVRLAYEDRTFRYGAVASGVTLLVCVVLWVRLRSNRASGAGPGGSSPGAVPGGRL